MSILFCVLLPKFCTYFYVQQSHQQTKQSHNKAPCYENKTRSQELNLDNKYFQQSWKHHDKAVVKMAAVSEI